LGKKKGLDADETRVTPVVEGPYGDIVLDEDGERDIPMFAPRGNPC
jgi:hypothetical protein